VLANTNVHTSFHWHLHQPLYWPDRRNYGTDHYETAWDTIQQQNAGRAHPSPEVLSTIFGVSDRVNAYQVSPRDAINSILGFPNAGAQVSYSGALMENVQSLGAAGQLGYGTNWYNPNRQARGWSTSGGHPRMDMVSFTYHHSLAPLISAETLEMELRIHQRQMEIFWGTNPATSRGFFPAETCFASYMIPTLQKVGISWSIIANNHLARSCADFPVTSGSGGENCDIPNRADQLNPAQGAGNYQRISIDRGCSPTQAMPFAFQLHYARYVDPSTGVGNQMIVVPGDQALGWKDSYSTWDLGLLSPLQSRNNPSKPSLALFAHDGDNAWSGGYSYYYQWVNQLANTAASDGYEATTVEQFIQEFPPASNDVVHVESGGWVYADGDFGSPLFINWHWPPGYSTNGTNVVDPSLGVSDKADNWRVIIATENRVKTAQQIAGVTPRVDQVRDPGSFATAPNAVELGWHYYLGSLDSGFVYYGCHDDECQRSVVAQSNVVRNIDSIITGNPNADTTPPTVFIPQRHPWNPGGTNFGVQYGYRSVVANNSDFWIWTYAYDVSGITNVSVFYRANGANAPTNDVFETYAGGTGAGAWNSLPMTRRIVTPVTGVTPQYVADYYYSKVIGVSNAYVDYYVRAVDAHGNTYSSPIQHVWVDAGSGATSGVGANTNGCQGRVCVIPTSPVAGSSVTLQYYPAGTAISSAANIYIHLGWNGWSTVVTPDALMTSVAASNLWQYTATVPNSATQLNCVFNNGSGTWDNNSGGNWNFSVVTNGNPQIPSIPANLTATATTTNQVRLSWSASSGASAYILNRAGTPFAVTTATTYTDGGLTPSTAYCYTVASSNSAGVSAFSPSVCTNTATVTIITNYPPFVMDGVVDSAGYLISTNSMVLYAALRGTKIYVATWSPGTSGANDHFIFVTDQLSGSATNPAPWAKSGMVAVSPNKPFLAGESQNTYVSWFLNNTATNLSSAKSSTNSGVMEGTFDLVQVFGYLPTNIYICAAAYQTANGGVLAAQSQNLGGSNLNTNSFISIPVEVLQDSFGNGVFDRLDPARGFVMLKPSKNNIGSFTINWAAMPGHMYQIVYKNSLTGSWIDLPGASNTAGGLQTSSSFTDSINISNSPQRYYKVRLVK
jgi:hypothetical protein